MAPVRTIRLELARAEDAGDPYAFRTGPQDYLLRWEGGAYEQAGLIWDAALTDDLAALRRPGRDPELVRRLGARLRRFVEPTRFDELADAFDAAAGPIRLDIVSAAAELFALPWELLSLRDGRHLGEVPDLEILYRWPDIRPVAPARDPAPAGGRILVAVSSAFGNVGEAQTVAAIADAAAAGFVDFSPERDLLAGASLGGLARWLEREVAGPDPPTVLHLLAHGVGDAVVGLGLDDGRGGREAVDGGALRRVLAPFAAQIRLVVLVACDSDHAAPDGLLGSLAQELHRAGFEAVIGARHPIAGTAALAFTRSFYVDLLVETCSIEHAFARARVGLARADGLAWAGLTLHGHGGPGGRGTRPVVFRPHRGLLSFEREHSRFFFGRDAERREAIADLDALTDAGKPRFLVVAGGSGTGKSSLVLAGIVPTLEARGWASAAIRPGRAPTRALDEALARRPTDARPFLLVVDQFEEIFTHADPSGDDPAAFVRRLWDMSKETDGQVRVILTIRVDYLGRCGEVPLDDDGHRLDLVAYSEDHRLFVAQMAEEQLAETITGPLARLGMSLEAGLARRLLDEIGGDPVGLPLLQYALDELWLRRRDDVLTHAALDAIGGVVGALTRHADAAIDALAAPVQHQARRLLVRLVAYGAEPATGTRRRELEADLRPAQAAATFDEAAAALVDARLLVRRTEAAGAALEVAHEALIRRWSRLWGWYERDRVDVARLRELAHITEQAALHKQLLSGNFLAHVEAVAAALGDDVAPETRLLLQRSRAAADRAARVRRLVRLAGALSLLVIVAVVVASRRSIAEQARRAEAASARDRDRALVSLALVELDERPHLAATLLREVARPELRQYRQAAFVATQALLPAAVVRLRPDGEPSPVTAVALAPDGDELITGHHDGAVRIWPTGLKGQVSTAMVLETSRAGDGRAVRELDVQRRDGGYLLLAHGGAALRVWRRDPDRVTPLLARDEPAEGAVHAISPAGLVARWSIGGDLEVLEIADDRLIPRQRREGCEWLDPAREHAACRARPDSLALYRWTDAEPIAALTRVQGEPWGLSGDVTLAHVPDPGRLDANAALVDPTTRRIAHVPEVWSPTLARRGLFTLICTDPCNLCERPGRPLGAEVCGALPADCDRPTLVGVHDELGALVRCQGARPRLRFFEVDPVAAVSLVRHEFTPPDRPTYDFALAGDHLVAATDDLRLWRWDLRDPPSGWLPRVTHGQLTALVHGTSSALELDTTFDDTAELRHVRWDRPTAAPTTVGVTVALPETRYAAALTADRHGYLAALAGDSTSLPRSPGEPAPTPPDGTLLWGEFPLTRPRLAVHPVSVEHFTAEGAEIARTGGIDHVARRPGSTEAAIPVDDLVSHIDLATPERRDPIDSPRILESVHGDPRERSAALLAAAFAPEGDALALAWEGGRAIFVTLPDRTIHPLPAAIGASCGAPTIADPVTAVAHAPTGRRLAVGRRSGRVDLLPWTPGRAPDPAAITALCGHPASIRALTFTPDGDAVVAAIAGGGLVIWTDLDAAAIDPIVQWLPGRPEIRDLSIADERLHVLTTDGRIWFTHITLAPAALAARVARSAALCLSAAERQTLLREDAAAAAAGESTCPPGHVLHDRATRPP